MHEANIVFIHSLIIFVSKAMARGQEVRLGSICAIAQPGGGANPSGILLQHHRGKLGCHALSPQGRHDVKDRLIKPGGIATVAYKIVLAKNDSGCIRAEQKSD